MPQITENTVLTDVEHILGSGTGTLDFAVKGENSYYTWHGMEDADWAVEDVANIENFDEDRFLIHPKGEAFTCEITSDDSGNYNGAVRCYCEDDN